MDHDELQSFLSAQHREIMAAQDVQSDLDFAFQVQMQEAMDASISLQPSSASSVPQTPQFHIPAHNSEDSSLVRVFAEEMMRFEQEHKDRELVEAEMGRMREDLNRCIHDQAFARDLLSVPEEEWMRTGEHFHRPYGEGSSAAATVANAETFRMYIKGLASRESGSKMLAGIGVAICDLRNEPIFELRKPLVGGETTGDVMEVKALIEGLNTALTLGVKRVTVYSDNKSLCQNVIGNALPTESNIATLVDQLTLLQRKFTCCDISLVTQKDIKFALKLAWDAILVQVTRPTETSLGKSLIESCSICLEDSDVNKIFSVDNCLHRYCFACMKQHVQVKLLQGKLPKCPHESCNSGLQIESCRKFLTYELYDMMSQHIKEASIPATDKIYCPYPSCSLLMSRNEILGNATNPFAGAQTGARKCMKCGGVFCVNCKVPWHAAMTCYDYKRLNPYACVEDPKLKSLATQNSWRQCVKCNHMVELAEGCYHIYCRCGYEFCYTCGAEWKNKKATCTCPIWDERNIIRN